MATEEPKKVLNTEALLERCLGNLELAERLTAKFLDQMDETLGQIEDRVHVEDAEGTARLAHTLKGSAASLSAEALREVLARLEAAARTENLHEAAACLTQARYERDRLTEEAPTALAIACEASANSTST